MNYLWIDFGEKRIGLSIGNDEVNIAFPLKNIAGDQGDEKILAQLIEVILSEESQEIVIGLPMLLSGMAGKQVSKIQEFAEKLKQALSQAHQKYPYSLPAHVPIHFWDERLSTTSAKRLMLDMGINTKKQKDKIDQAAASLILQAFLDAKKNQNV
jgi:putative Holliday junction resolvase